MVCLPIGVATAWDDCPYGKSNANTFIRARTYRVFPDLVCRDQPRGHPSGPAAPSGCPLGWSFHTRSENPIRTRLPQVLLHFYPRQKVIVWPTNHYVMKRSKGVFCILSCRRRPVQFCLVILPQGEQWPLLWTLPTEQKMFPEKGIHTMSRKPWKHRLECMRRKVLALRRPAAAFLNKNRCGHKVKVELKCKPEPPSD